MKIHDNQSFKNLSRLDQVATRVNQNEESGPDLTGCQNIRAEEPPPAGPQSSENMYASENRRQALLARLAASEQELDTTQTSQPPDGFRRRVDNERVAFTATLPPAGANTGEFDQTDTSQPAGGRLRVEESDLQITNRPPGSPLERALAERAVPTLIGSPGGEASPQEMDITNTTQPPDGFYLRSPDDEYVQPASGARIGGAHTEEYDMTQTSRPSGDYIREVMDEGAVVTDTLPPEGTFSDTETDSTVTSRPPDRKAGLTDDEPG